MSNCQNCFRPFSQDGELDRVKYQLHYRNHVIATIEENDADFPTFFGSYTLAADIEAPELADVRDYIEYSIRIWPLIEQDRLEESPLDEDQRFIDLIETDEWSLTEVESQKRISILIPIFCTNNGINWRLNPDL